MSLPEIVYGIVVVLLSVAGGYAGNRLQAKTAQRAAVIEQERVDGEAYDRAKVINDGIVHSLTVEVERMQVKVHELTSALDEALARARAAERDREQAERDRDHYRALLDGGPNPTVAGGNA